MEKVDPRQHVIVDEDYHKTIKSIAGTKGIDMKDVVQDILKEDPYFKKKLAETKRENS